MNQISIQSKRFALLVVAAIVLAACGGSSENSSSASSAVTRTKNNALPTEITTTTATTTTVASTTTAVESCEKGGACAVGDTGPGGGKVFYVASTSFTSTGSACGTACMYLEAAPIGWIESFTPPYQTNCEILGGQFYDPMCAWSGNTSSSIGTTGTGIGEGYPNTSKMINQSSTKGKAATVARAFQGGGKTDWHLPSKDEAYQMHLQKYIVGTFSNGTSVNGYYWSSSEDTKTLAWLDRKIYSKTTKQYVRPVRAFSGTSALGLAAVVTTTTSTTVAPTTTSTTTAPTTTSTTIASTTSSTTVAANKSVVLSCAKGGACAVGDVGPGGGKVFYVASSSFASIGSACGIVCMYLEAAIPWWMETAGQSCWFAVRDWDPKCYWSANINSRIGTTGTGIGKGYANTSAMNTQNGTREKAGTEARAYRGGNKTDWFLPSKDELNQMYIRRSIVDLFGTNYWSSSENDASTVWLQNFVTGVQRTSDQKYRDYYVRPIRAFAPLKCFEGGACAVGDTGPGGGKVFYVSASGFTSTGSACGTKCMYLETAPTGWITAATPAGQKNCTTLGTSTLDPKCEWSGNATVAIAPVGKLIGTGYANTSAMITQSGTTGKAGTVARAFQGGGKTDWYLPSRDELYEMSLNMGIIGIDSGKYWSSTQAENSASASLRSFNLGYELDGFKTTANYVRPVRAF